MALQYQTFKKCILAISLIYLSGFFYGYIIFCPSNVADTKITNSVNFNLVTIVFNNLFVTLVTMFSGILTLGLLPLYFTFNEAFHLSTLLHTLAIEHDLSVLRLFIIGILPHGFLEIPAYILSSSLGLYVGYRLLYNIKRLNTTLTIEKIKLSFVEYYNKITPLVVFAGILEVMITPIIIFNFL